jgi:cyclopropane fatty-acyl-phospholipid synthase-like methyltransferase
MLRLANVRKGDVLYDLGSGDGRIAITAAKK